MQISALLTLVLAAAFLLTGCASTSSKPPQADFVFVYLKTGPESANKTAEQRQTIFAGHMSNMKRLADAGTLIIAGPFSKPHDPAWRGIFVFDLASVDRARDLVATDPGVMAGVFTPELRPFRASPVLRQTLELEREMKAAAEKAGTPPPKPGEPPPNIRPYVMVTALDAPRAAAAIARSPLAGSVVWSGRFADAGGAGGGVFVLDAKSADEVRPLLPASATGECWIDGWFSTTSLEKLPRP